MQTIHSFSLSLSFFLTVHQLAKLFFHGQLFLEGILWNFNLLLQRKTKKIERKEKERCKENADTFSFLWRLRQHMAATQELIQPVSQSVRERCLKTQKDDCPKNIEILWSKEELFFVITDLLLSFPSDRTFHNLKPKSIKLRILRSSKMSIEGLRSYEIVKHSVGLSPSKWKENYD